MSAFTRTIVNHLLRQGLPVWCIRGVTTHVPPRCTCVLIVGSWKLLPSKTSLI